MIPASPLLEIEELRVSIRNAARDDIQILRGVSLSAATGEVVAIVGESGSGKSMTTRAVMRLLPGGATVDGRISLDGDDVLAMGTRKLAALRASRVGMIYQDPRAHINPLWTVGDFLVEGVVHTTRTTRAQARQRALDLRAEVGIPDGERRMAQYPHQLSGGLLQRIMIVSSLMGDPQLIIADEATTALDVTVQASVMEIFRRLIATRDLTMLFITHDLDLASSVADQIVVMYAGRVLEQGPARSVYTAPAHPYTDALLRSRPDPRSRQPLVSIPGKPASAAETPTGCPFAPRCEFAVDRCREEVPRLRLVNDSMVACHRADELRRQPMAVSA